MLNSYEIPGGFLGHGFGEFHLGISFQLWNFDGEKNEHGFLVKFGDILFSDNRQYKFNIIYIYMFICTNLSKPYIYICLLGYVYWDKPHRSQTCFFSTRVFRHGFRHGNTIAGFHWATHRGGQHHTPWWRRWGGRFKVSDMTPTQSRTAGVLTKVFP